jgi:nicotinamidase/pyrazinamidase
MMATKNALSLVDLQNDFVPGGALAVPEGDAVMEVANRLQGLFDVVVATQDWHPPDHGSFAANRPGGEIGELSELGGLPQVLWPVHCVQGTPGAELHPALRLREDARVFVKGTDPGIDSYSGFFDNGHRKATGLGDYLRAQGVGRVWVMGLATDYCVKFTALDAVAEGFETALVLDGARGVDLTPGDVDRAVDELREAGVRVVWSAGVSRELGAKAGA